MRYWVVFWVLLGFLTAGCGQKGDLYLPDNPPKADLKKPSASAAVLMAPP